MGGGVGGAFVFPGRPNNFYDVWQNSLESMLERLVSQFGGKKKFGWGFVRSLGDFTPSFNKAPGSLNPVIIASTHVNSAAESNVQLVIQVMLWGLVPSFVSNSLKQASFGNKFATANARAENILQRPSYMDCIKHRRRCVVVAQGFYEWKRLEGGKKAPFFISLPALLLQHLYMIVIFKDPEDIFEWINPELCSPVSTVRFLQYLINKLELLKLKIYPVTPLMNSTSFDCPQCIEPLKHSKLSVKNFPKDKKIDRFFAMKRKIPENTESAPVEEIVSKKRIDL
ncbi:Abasic site processing protein HMCES [Taenia crassiceps]|uniref:Abasic site processing protein HMCES n=1 Tax=Taenia crassiceps TaxID=6207 RepID=A0ABR4QF42_9CEST